MIEKNILTIRIYNIIKILTNSMYEYQ